MAGPLPVIFPPAPQQVPPWTANQQVLTWPGPLPVPPWAAPATSGHILCTSVAQPSSPQVQPARASLKRRAAVMSQPHTFDEGEVEAKKARMTIKGNSVALPSTSVSEQKKKKKREKRRQQRKRRQAAKSIAQPSSPQVQPAPACAPHKRHTDAMSQEIQTRKRARTLHPAQPSCAVLSRPGPSSVLSEVQLSLSLCPRLHLCQSRPWPALCRSHPRLAAAPLQVPVAPAPLGVPPATLPVRPAPAPLAVAPLSRSCSRRPVLSGCSRRPVLSGCSRRPLRCRSCRRPLLSRSSTWPVLSWYGPQRISVQLSLSFPSAHGRTFASTARRSQSYPLLWWSRPSASRAVSRSFAGPADGRSVAGPATMFFDK
nr:histone acetyltransferase p300-like [Misgurnus anguillicaudatus]